MEGTGVPVAAVDEDGHAAARKDKVRRAALGKARVQAKATAGCVNRPAQDDLRRGRDLRPARQVATGAGGNPRAGCFFSRSGGGWLLGAFGV